MSTTREELESFHRFVLERLALGEATQSLDQLLMEWEDQNSRDEINESIRRGLADVAAGRQRPADESLEALRQQFGFPEE